jgi:hypothetical protein
MKTREINTNINGYLDLSNACWTAEDLEKYQADIIQANPSPVYINLNSNYLDVSCMKILANIINKIPTLKYLSFSDCSISDDELIILSDVLINHPNLVDINFENNFITDNGILYFSNALLKSPSSSLLLINFSMNRLTNDSLEKLAEAISKSKVARINLSCNRIEDAGVNFFVQYCKKPCEIIAEYTGISDELQQQLSTLSKPKVHPLATVTNKKDQPIVSNSDLYKNPSSTNDKHVNDSTTHPSKSNNS